MKFCFFLPLKRERLNVEFIPNIFILRFDTGQKNAVDVIVVVVAVVVAVACNQFQVEDK